MILTTLIGVWCITFGIFLGRMVLDWSRGFPHGPRTFDDIMVAINIVSACFFAVVKVLS